jgi:hypothetical protein
MITNKLCQLKQIFLSFVAYSEEHKVFISGFFCLNPLSFASCTDTVKLLEA